MHFHAILCILPYFSQPPLNSLPWSRNKLKIQKNLKNPKNKSQKNGSISQKKTLSMPALIKFERSGPSKKIKFSSNSILNGITTGKSSRINSPSETSIWLKVDDKGFALKQSGDGNLRKMLNWDNWFKNMKVDGSWLPKNFQVQDF